MAEGIEYLKRFLRGKDPSKLKRNIKIFEKLLNIVNQNDFLEFLLEKLKAFLQFQLTLEENWYRDMLIMNLIAKYEKKLGNIEKSEEAFKACKLYQKRIYSEDSPYFKSLDENCYFP